MSILALVLPLLAALPAGDVPPEPASDEVVLELRGGYTIEGTLLEETDRAVVLAVGGGIVRVQHRRIRRMHRVADTVSPPAVGDEIELPKELPPPPVGGLGSPTGITAPSRPTGRRLDFELALEGGRAADLAFVLPARWVETPPAEASAGTSRTPRRFRLSGEDARLEIAIRPARQSLWALPAVRRGQWREELAAFTARSERFGNLWGDVRTWEIEFDHALDGTTWHERHLFLDFGGVHGEVSFRAPASRFDRVVPSSSAIIGRLTFRRQEVEARVENEVEDVRVDAAPAVRIEIDPQTIELTPDVISPPR